VTRRDQTGQGKRFIPRDEFVGSVVAELEAVQKALFDQALELQKKRTVTNIKTRAEFEAYFKKDADNTFVSGQGFVCAKWSGDVASLKIIEELGVTVRCIPFDQDGKQGACVLTGVPAMQDVIFARAY
jgi:prolyl-tRNA synthetase